MVRAGQFRDRAVFERSPDGLTDEYGDPTGGWKHLATAWADFRETPGKEAMAAGRLESTKTGTLRVRASAAMRAIHPGDRVTVRGEAWNIRSLPAQIDRAGAVLEFTVETGGAI